MPDGLTDQFITKLTIGYGAQRMGIETTPADLRRSFAVLAYQRGAPIEQIQSLLIRDSIQNTRRRLGGVRAPTVQVSPGDRFGVKV